MPLLIAGLVARDRRRSRSGRLWGRSGGGSETSLNLTIGDLVPLTGDLSAFGPPGRKAADLAVKQIQAAAKEAGADHTVEIVHGDDGSNPQAGVRGCAQAGRCRERELPRGRVGLSDHDPGRTSVAISDQVLHDLARLHR